MIGVSGWVVVLLLGSAGYAGPETKSVADFYKGKTIEIYVPTAAGGGYDTSIRTVAPYLEKNTQAAVSVINKPGGSMMLAPKYVYSATKPDGLSLCMVQTLSAALYHVLERKGDQDLDITKLNWLGSISSETFCVFVNAKSPYKSLMDLREAKEIKFGLTGAYGTPAVVSRILLQEALGIRGIRPILGIEASPAVALAVVRGEYDGAGLPARGIVRHAKEGMIRPLVVVSPTRFPELPDVPTLSEVLKDWNISGEAKFWVEQVLAFNRLYRTVVTTPGVPADRVEFLRKALKQCFQEKELLQMGERLMLDFQYAPGEEVTKTIETFANMSPERKARFKELMKF